MTVSVGRNSSVGIVTCYRLALPGMPVGAMFYSPALTGPGTHLVSCTVSTCAFPGVKRPERGVDHPSHLAPRLKRSRAILLLPHWVFIVCFCGDLCLYHDGNYVDCRLLVCDVA